MSAPSTPTTTSSRNPSPAPARRPNRAALRDYYNLKTSNVTDVSSNDNESVQHEEVEVKESELDAEGFDAEGYVRGVLAGEGVEGVLRVEGGLIGGTFLAIPDAGGKEKGSRGEGGLSNAVLMYMGRDQRIGW